MDVIALVLPPLVHVSPILGAAFVLVLSVDWPRQSVLTGQVADRMAVLP